MKILLAVGRDPWPARRGDQLRSSQFVEALNAAHEVTVLAPSAAGAASGDPAGGRARVERYRRTLADRGIGLLSAALRGRPLQAGLYASGDLDRRLVALAGDADLVVVQLARLERAVRALGRSGLRVPVIVDLVDALSLGARSRARVEHPARRRVVQMEAERLARLEGALLERCAAATVVATRDLEAIAARNSPQRGKLAVVPLALVGRAEAARAGPGGRRRVVLTGNLGYFVNRDAVLFVLRHVWPGLRAARPEVELVVAGARADAGLRRAVARAGATLLADPPSLDAVLAEAAVALAPMRCGSGTPIKILEAWAAGVPVVASPHAAAGTLGVAGREMLVAEHREAWVPAILRLLDNVEERARLIGAGRALLAREHSPAKLRFTLEELMASVVGG
jgi:hypothetical protein